MVDCIKFNCDNIKEEKEVVYNYLFKSNVKKINLLNEYCKFKNKKFLNLNNKWTILYNETKLTKPEICESLIKYDMMISTMDNLDDKNVNIDISKKILYTIGYTADKHAVFILQKLEKNLSTSLKIIVIKDKKFGFYEKTLLTNDTILDLNMKLKPITLTDSITLKLIMLFKKNNLDCNIVDFILDKLQTTTHYKYVSELFDLAKTLMEDNSNVKVNR